MTNLKTVTGPSSDLIMMTDLISIARKHSFIWVAIQTARRSLAQLSIAENGDTYVRSAPSGLYRTYLRMM